MENLIDGTVGELEECSGSPYVLDAKKALSTPERNFSTAGLHQLSSASDSRTIQKTVITSGWCTSSNGGFSGSEDRFGR